MIGLRPQEILLLTPLVLVFGLGPIIAGIWALVTLGRIRKAQARLSGVG